MPKLDVHLDVGCEDQVEVDLYWNRLVNDGGQESMCGWCKDKYNFNWQIVPKRFIELIGDLLNADLDDGETLAALHLALLARRRTAPRG